MGVGGLQKLILSPASQTALSVLAVTVLLYNGWIAYVDKFKTSGDAIDYISLAVSLSKYQSFSDLEIEGGVINAFEEKRIEMGNFSRTAPHAWRPPIWPLVMACLFSLFGYSLLNIIIFKIILHVLGMYIFYRILKLLDFNAVLIILGTFAYAVNPASQLFLRIFLSEPLTIFFITLWLFLLIRYLNNRNCWWPQALLGGIIILTHPYYLFLPFSVWFLLFIKKYMKLKFFFFSCLVCTSVVSIWVARNWLVVDSESLMITSSSGVALAKGWNEEVVELHTNTKGDLANERLVLQNYPYDRTEEMGAAQRSKLFQNATLHFIKNHPQLVFPIIGKKITSAFNPFPETPKSGITEFGRTFFHFLALCAFLYIIIFSRNGFYKSLTLGLILSTIAITIIAYSGFRFRMPQAAIELLLILYVCEEVFFQAKEKYVLSAQNREVQKDD